MTDYFNPTYLAWNSGPTVRGVGNSPEGGLDVTAIDDGHVQSDGSGPGGLPGPSRAMGIGATARGELSLSITGLDWDDSYYGTSPWVDSYKNYWTMSGASASNPVVWVKVWGGIGWSYPRVNFGSASSLFYTSEQMKDMHLPVELVSAPGGLTLPNGNALTRVFEWGNMPLSFTWRRDITNMSVTGSKIIPPGNITWNRPPEFVGPSSLLIVDPPVAQMHDFSVTVSGTSSLEVWLLWQDPNDPGSWLPDAQYGMVPDSKIKPSVAPPAVQRPDFINTAAWSVLPPGTIDGHSAGSVTERSMNLRSYGNSDPAFNQPAGFYILDTATGNRSYWAFDATPYECAAPQVAQKSWIFPNPSVATGTVDESNQTATVERFSPGYTDEGALSYVGLLDSGTPQVYSRIGDTSPGGPSSVPFQIGFPTQGGQFWDAVSNPVASGVWYISNDTGYNSNSYIVNRVGYGTELLNANVTNLDGSSQNVVAQAVGAEPDPAYLYRPTTLKSTSGTGIITADVTHNGEMYFFTDGATVHSFDWTVAGASAVTVEVYHEDPADPADWTADAQYGFVPNGKAFIPTSGDDFVSSSASVNELDYSPGGTSVFAYPKIIPADILGCERWSVPFAVKVTAGGKSLFYELGDTVSAIPGVSDPDEDGTDITTPGGDWSLWPDDPEGTGSRPGLGGGSGSTPSPYPNVTLPEGPDGPPLLEVVNPPDENAPSYRLPPGSLGDAPIRMVNVGRMLYVYYGGERVISYLIPAAQYAALRASSTYVGYINVATWDNVSAPVGVTIELASPGYEFTWGTYTASMGRSPYLWVWAQNPDNAIDILVESGVARGVEGPTQDEIDAATTHIAGGRDPDVQSTISYANALEVATQYNTASVVTAVQP